MIVYDFQLKQRYTNSGERLLLGAQWDDKAPYMEHVWLMLVDEYIICSDWEGDVKYFKCLWGRGALQS